MRKRLSRVTFFICEGESVIAPAGAAVHSWPFGHGGPEGVFFLALVSVLEKSARSCTVCVSIMGVTFSLCFL